MGFYDDVCVSFEVFECKRVTRVNFCIAITDSNPLYTITLECDFGSMGGVGTVFCLVLLCYNTFVEEISNEKIGECNGN